MPNTTRFNQNLVDNDSDLLYKNRSVLTSLGLGNTVWVSTIGGDDASGMVGRIDRPFKTIQAGVNACSVYGTWYHVIVMGGYYDESVITPASFQQGIIEYMPNAIHTYSGNDDKYTITISDEKVLLKGHTVTECFIDRSGTNTGGAVYFYASYGIFSALQGLTITSTGTSHAVKGWNYIRNCNIKSTGGIAAAAQGYINPVVENSIIISTASIALYATGKISVSNSYISGNTYGAYNENGTGIFAVNSTFIGVTQSAYYGNNWNYGSKIENCYFKGFVKPLRMDTYAYGDPNNHLIRNTIIEVTDAAATTCCTTWYLVGQNIICNKPMFNNLPVLEQDIIVSDAITISDTTHSFQPNHFYNRIS